VCYSYKIIHIFSPIHEISTLKTKKVEEKINVERKSSKSNLREFGKYLKYFEECENFSRLLWRIFNYSKIFNCYIKP
jgi:hypothetical protein